MATNPVTPSRSLAAQARAELLGNSPHYTTTRRHSLYGTEDRIVIDPGSRIWKVGFSGEGRPRDVFAVKSWTPDRTTIRSALEQMEEERTIELELQDRLRRVFFNSLLADPKSRKVIIIEPPLMSLTIKDTFARVLFQNLEVPSVSFMPSHLLALLAVGRVTGLVLDCGHLESTALPIYSSRPLFSLVRTTALAGARLTSHLRALLLLFGSYRPPPTIIRAAAPPPPATRIPEEILTDALVEQVKTKCLFVGPPMNESLPGEQDDGMEIDQSSSASVGTPSESGRSSRMSMSAGNVPQSPAPSSSHISGSGVSGSIGSLSAHPEGDLRALAALYQRQSTATDIQLRVIPPPAQAASAGSFGNARGTLVVPGWIRERAAEVLFEGGDVDERSVVELILDVLLKVPVDLRKNLASSILVVGGTAMLPGFIPRLQAEVLKTLSTPPHPPPVPRQAPREGHLTPTPSASGAATPDVITPTATRFPQPPPHPSPPRPSYDPYALLRTIVPHVAILNNPSPGSMEESSSYARANAGKAPAFAPALMPWVGGSLAGALKIGSEEIPRERWDEAFERDTKAQELELKELGTAAAQESPSKTQGQQQMPPAQAIGAAIALQGGGLHPPAFAVLPDWTRSPLTAGAPNVVWDPSGSPQVGVTS